MGKRKKIFELIDEHVESPQVRGLVVEYITNLHVKINELNESLDAKKKRVNVRRTKRMTVPKWKAKEEVE